MVGGSAEQVCAGSGTLRVPVILTFLPQLWCYSGRPKRAEFRPNLGLGRGSSGERREAGRPKGSTGERPRPRTGGGRSCPDWELDRGNRFFAQPRNPLFQPLSHEPMRIICIATLAVVLACAGAPGPAIAQPANIGPAITQPANDAPHIEWEVKNRFRLFRNERDFQRHVAAHRADGVLAAEMRLARDSDGQGWAKDMVGNLCIDATGRVPEFCVRDGTREDYLAPTAHHIGVVLANAPPDATCAWTFENPEDPPQQISVNCEEEVKLFVRYGRTTTVGVDIMVQGAPLQHATAEIAVRDLLITGLGDSIASGEGNPDRAVSLSDDGFCFRRFLGAVRSEYFRPGRAGYRGDKSCESGPDLPQGETDWARHGARWLNAPCHRSLYSYQTRVALALAVEEPHVAVTFIPLGCTGATINAGLFNPQRTRECPSSTDGSSCSGTVPGELGQLRDLLTLARRHNANRNLDLMLLTVGANDIKFAGLVANIIIKAGTERALFGRGGLITSVEDAQRTLDSELPSDFAKLRAALKPLVGENLQRVVYVSYGHPGLQADGSACPGGRDGFDVHPAFAVDAQRMRETSEFVSERFLPRLKALARCESGVLCDNPALDSMTFVDGHQQAFVEHGFCARSNEDPIFDRECFQPGGNSFTDNAAEAATHPLTCEHEPAEFRPYAHRARWIRTANDSYFSAMTYPQGLPSALQPSDIHDATWGATSAVYGGAIHPTAEGHAAMADAVLPAVRSVLGLSGASQ